MSNKKTEISGRAALTLRTTENETGSSEEQKMPMERAFKHKV